MGWTRFMDMHSGGDLKLPPYTHIYIESDGKDDGVALFERRFDRHPENITCECCGEDYSISFGEDLVQLTGFKEYTSLEKYLSRRDVLFIKRGEE